MKCQLTKKEIGRGVVLLLVAILVGCNSGNFNDERSPRALATVPDSASSPQKNQTLSESLVSSQGDYMYRGDTSILATPTPTPTDTAVPDDTPLTKPLPVVKPDPIVKPVPVVKPIPSPVVSTPTPTPTPSPTPVVSPTPTPTPSPTPVVTPTPSPTPAPPVVVPPVVVPPQGDVTTPKAPSCDIWVHYGNGKPSYGVLFVPAVRLRPGEDLDRAERLRGYLIKPFEGDTMTINGFTYQVVTAHHFGSTQCPAVPGKNYSPLVINLDGKGIELSGPDQFVDFDLEGTGVKEHVAWPMNPPGTFANVFLVLPRNGAVYNINELFGNNTVGPDGKKAPNGFAALAKYDEPQFGGNGDHFIDANDAIYNELRVWADFNYDGIAQPNELKTLAEVGITRIDLADQVHLQLLDIFGTVSIQRSITWMQHGCGNGSPFCRIFDVWFDNLPNQ